MAPLGRRERASLQRSLGWRPQSLQGGYDVVVVGGGALAVATAWAVSLQDPAARVAVLAPTKLGAAWDPATSARLHALRVPAELTSLVPRAAVRYRAWADELGLEPPRVRGGHVVLCTTTATDAAVRAAATLVPSCRAVRVEERLELVAGHDPDAALGGWHEPLATTMDLHDLVFRLAEAAARAGVDLVDDAAVANMVATAEGYRLVTTAGATTAAAVLDVDPLLTVSRAAGLTGTLVAAGHQQLTTTALAPLLGVSITVDDVAVSQRTTGELDLIVPMASPLERGGLAAAAAGVRRVVRALPFLGGAVVADRRSRHEAISLDELPIIGSLAPRLWCAGGLGHHRFDLLPLVAESLAAAALSGQLDGSLAGFAPQRQHARRAAVLPSAARYGCPVCGSRDRSEFVLAAGRLVHAAGCGRALGADSPSDLMIDLRERPPVPPLTVGRRSAQTDDGATGSAGEHPAAPAVAMVSVGPVVWAAGAELGQPNPVALGLVPAVEAVESERSRAVLAGAAGALGVDTPRRSRPLPPPPSPPAGSIAPIGRSNADRQGTRLDRSVGPVVVGRPARAAPPGRPGGPPPSEPQDVPGLQAPGRSSATEERP